MKPSPYKKLLGYYKIATKLDDEGEYEQAIFYYDKVIGIDSAFYGGPAGKATSLYFLGKFNDALIWIDKALDAGIQQIKYSQQPFDNPITLAQKSHILAKLERFDEAFSCINKALTINPKCVHVQQAKKFVIKEFEKLNGGTR
jgi:tetratricopeptide (TPR) repeat protein